MVRGARVPALAAAHALYEVARQLGLLQTLHRCVAVGYGVGQQHAHAAHIADLSRELSRVHARDARDVVLVHELGERLGVAEV